MKLRRLLSAVTALLLVCSLPVSVLAAEYDLAAGSITVTAKADGQYVTQADNGIVDQKEESDTVIKQTDGNETSTTNTITIKAEENTTANVTIQDVDIVISDTGKHSGEAAVTIDVADSAEANVTLDSVNIDVGGTGHDYMGFPGEAALQITGNGNVTIELDGENTVQGGYYRAGVEKNTIAPTDTTPGSGNGKLTITDENGTSGSLEATGGHDGSGIGGGDGRSCSDITITGSAEVTAQGGTRGAGIGGGMAGSGRNITITGSAEVTAQGGECGAGIGGGTNGNGIDITITGSAEVTAKGGDRGAGIGGGYKFSANGTGSNITISQNAQVKAQGGNAGHWGYNDYAGSGAAIGNGGKYQYGSDPGPGGEETPKTDALNEGWIAKYTPGTTGLDTATPDSLTYQDNGQLTTSGNAVPIAKQEPTCTQDGHEAGFSVDGALVAVTIPKTGHSFTNYVPDGKATCTADGTKTAQCDHAGCKATDTVTDPGTMKEHSFTNYISDNNATYTSDGTKTAKCD
ncbi:MAG: hypothetical protein PUD38_06675, partial [Firmicutes bacterium]|nr:hypothetical protein [Bacillota bacterium]